MEACRIGIHRKSATAFDVGAPMKYKELCYDMLQDAAAVVATSDPFSFRDGQTEWVLVMDMSGRVDVSAPIPVDYPVWIAAAREMIERYNDDSAPALRPFNDIVMGGV